MNKEIEKIYRRRLNKTKILSFFLVRLPFIRCVILNGSMATGEIKKSSDIDLLIIARKGRIFTARFLAVLLVLLAGQKRLNGRAEHSGKFCLNYFLTDYSLIIPHNRSGEINKYCALNYSNSVLVAGDVEIFKNFVHQNIGWMARYTENYQFSIFDFQKHLTPSTYFLKPLVEMFLSGWLGDQLEGLFKNIQITKINKDPRTQKYPDLIVVNDRELRFHPPKGGSM